MTVKAGQKCTAIRRVIVPAGDRRRGHRGDLGAAGEDHRRQPRRRVACGWARWRSLGQRDEVRKAVQALRGSAEVVFGDPDRVDVVDGDAERGAFMSPVLLRASEGAGEPHDVEPFGPVSTVLTYDARRPRRSRWPPGARAAWSARVVTHDPDVARTVVLGLAPWHGRILVLDRDDAKESTGHGSPLPVLVHGGPGRAGGGEELGGIRGVLHHMQRTAIQASPDMLTAITGRWTTGSRQTVDATCTRSARASRS